MPCLSFKAEPAELAVDTETAALIIIDMQRDFLEPGGFGAALGNDVSLLQAAIVPSGTCSRARRSSKLMIQRARVIARTFPMLRR